MNNVNDPKGGHLDVPGTVNQFLELERQGVPIDWRGTTLKIAQSHAAQVSELNQMLVAAEKQYSKLGAELDAQRGASKNPDVAMAFLDE